MERHQSSKLTKITSLHSRNALLFRHAIEWKLQANIVGSNPASPTKWASSLNGKGNS